MVYSLEPSGGVQYYTQANPQSGVLTGSVGALLFNSSGSVVGFIPEDIGYPDVTIGSATASSLTSADGTCHLISSSAIVIAAVETY